MHSKLFALQIALSAAFARTWPWVSVRLLDFFACFLITLPVCWIVYTVGFAVFRCITIEPGLGMCLVMISVAPLIMMTPPIIHDEVEPIPTHRLEIIFIAFAPTLAWASIANFRKNRQKRNDPASSDDGSVR